MFGFVKPCFSDLSSEDRDFYQSYYCGLCRALHDGLGLKGRMTLSYDMTFLVLLLTALYLPEEEHDRKRCVAHPVTPQAYRMNEYSRYGADLNILLTYYDLRDDREDGNRLAGGVSSFYKEYAETLTDRYPRQNTAILEALDALRETERLGILDPDRCAMLSGRMMRELFVVKEDENADRLRCFGEALGRFIYLCDAAVDLDSDLRRERFNPLVMIRTESVSQMLEVAASDCADALSAFELRAPYKAILENVIYAGIWTEYTKNKKRKRTAT